MCFTLGFGAAALVSSLAYAETFPAEAFNGMQITYSVSGATIEKTEDTPGFTTSRGLSGKLGEGTLRISGSGGMGSGFSADLSVRVWAGDQSQELKVNIPSGWPGMNQKPFDLSVSIPRGASGGFSIDMTGFYNVGTRGLVVSGAFEGSGGGAGDASAPSPAPETKKIPIRLTLEVSQELAPPTRIIGLKVRKPIESIIGQGSAIHRLVAKVADLPPAAVDAVRVRFEIDPPSRITGPARRVVLQEGQAVTTFVYKPSDASGQGGVIFARAAAPAALLQTGDEYEASDEEQTCTAKIQPICDEGSSIYYNDNLISDITYDLSGLNGEFQKAIDEYGREKISASHYTIAGLGWFLAHPSGSAMGLTIQYYTGQERALHRYILSEGSKERIRPGQLFKKAIELNGGDMTKALLTCHNVVRAAARGAESFPKVLTPEELELLSKKTGLTRQDLEQRQEILLSSGEFVDSRIFKCLQQLRPGNDNQGAWYHMMGTATMSLATQSNAVVDNAIQFPQTGFTDRPTLNRVVWAEEYLQSGDIYSDPNEYCIDHYGLRVGDYLRSVLTGVRREQIGNNIRSVLQKLHDPALKGGGGGGGGGHYLPIAVRCPVTVTVTDRRTDRFFKLDQRSGEVAGDLALGYGLEPEGDFFGLLAVFPRGDLEIRLEALASGVFSLATYDSDTRTAASFERVGMSEGDSFSLPVPDGDVRGSLRGPQGTSIAAHLAVLDQAEVDRIGQEAQQFALTERGFEIDAVTGQARRPSAFPVASAAARGPIWMSVVAVGLLVCGVSVLLIARARSRRERMSGAGSGRSRAVMPPPPPPLRPRLRAPSTAPVIPSSPPPLPSAGRTAVPPPLPVSEVVVHRSQHIDAPQLAGAPAPVPAHDVWSETVLTEPARIATLVCTRGALLGRRFDVPPEGLVVGRSRNCQIQVRDGRVSGMHVWIGIKAGRLSAVDMGSSNGTFIGSVARGKIHWAPLADRDTIIVGHADACTLELSVQSSP